MISLLQTKLLILLAAGYAALLIGMSVTLGPAIGLMRALLWVLLVNFLLHGMLYALLACRKPRRPSAGNGHG